MACQDATVLAALACCLQVGGFVQQMPYLIRTEIHEIKKVTHDPRLTRRETGVRPGSGCQAGSVTQGTVRKGDRTLEFALKIGTSALKSPVPFSDSP